MALVIFAVRYASITAAEFYGDVGTVEDEGTVEGSLWCWCAARDATVAAVGLIACWSADVAR